MQWHSQDDNNTTNIIVKVYFTLSALSTTNALIWKSHVHDSLKSRYDMILGRDLLLVESVYSARDLG